MDKKSMDLPLKVLTFLEGTADKYFNHKSEHTQAIERMHTNEMDTKKECLEKILFVAAPLVAAGTFYLKGKAHDKTIGSETVAGIGQG